MSNMYNNSKKEPTISVIIPVFDAQETIERCVQSLQKQTYGKLEFLFIDDGSTDATSEIIKRHQVSDNRIRYYYQSNNGVSSARNYGLELAQGEYIGFCDADDWYEHNMIEVMVRTIEEQNVDVVMCDTDIIDLADGKIQKEYQTKYNRIKIKKSINH